MMYRTAKLNLLRPMVVPFDFAQGRLMGEPAFAQASADFNPVIARIYRPRLAKPIGVFL